ncbi:hypothetical protein CEW92_11725 [Bacillaceae bacterium SAS-127]|nr:hypothetical protein CEW92_11725 [Bacillaceae bacterium SAS-127]
MAHQLQYSPRTIEHSITKLFDKLKVKSRTEALLKARKHHILPLVDVQ